VMVSGSHELQLVRSALLHGFAAVVIRAVLCDKACMTEGRYQKKYRVPVRFRLDLRYAKAVTSFVGFLSRIAAIRQFRRTPPPYGGNMHRFHAAPRRLA
jgi:type VI protein secretion system component VasF